MSATASDVDLDSYMQLPIFVDPASKTLSASSSLCATDPSLAATISTINYLHTTLKSLDTPNSIPPPPLPNNLPTQKRSAQITKLREAASTAYRKFQFADAIRLYSFAIDMASGRPPWEPVSLIRDELSALYRDRAQAHMGLREWVEGWKDCEASVECKRPQGEKGKVWWRGGRCLGEMGRWAEAVEWLEKGGDCEENLKTEDRRELRAMLAEAKKKVEGESA